MFGGGVDSLEAYQDCFSPYVCAGWEGLDPAMRSEEGLWTPFSALPVVIIYNTKLVVPGQITGWRDLFSPAWQGRIAFCDPSVSGSSFTGADHPAPGGGRGHGRDPDCAFAVSLDGRQLDSSGAVLDSVAGGTDLVGITLEETALKRAAAGEDIALIYPDDGTSCIPDGGALVQGAPHPENAQEVPGLHCRKRCAEPAGDGVFQTPRTGRSGERRRAAAAGGARPGGLRPGLDRGAPRQHPHVLGFLSGGGEEP